MRSIKLLIPYNSGYVKSQQDQMYLHFLLNKFAHIDINDIYIQGVWYDLSMYKQFEAENGVKLAQIKDIHDITGNVMPIKDLGSVSIAGFVDLRQRTTDEELRVLPLCLIDGEFPVKPYEFETATDITYYTYAPDDLYDAHSPIPPAAGLSVRWESRIIVPEDGSTAYACRYGDDSLYDRLSAHIFSSPVPYNINVFNDEVEASLQEDVIIAGSGGKDLLPIICDF